MLRLIERAAYRTMRWKNGLGFTTQIAIHPAHATAEDFSWRISMARVDTDGPFSKFPGVERTLAVLEGAGIALDFLEDRVVKLSCGSGPFAFAADVPVEARLIGGPIVDLNVMTRRGEFSHSVQACAGPMELKATATTLIFAHGAALRIDDGLRFVQVARGDTAICDGAPQGLKIIPEGSGKYFLVQLESA